MARPTQPIDQELPQSLEAEQAVIGSCLIDPDAIEKVAPIVNPGDFYREPHAIIYRSMLDLYEKGMEVDFTTVRYELGRRGVLEKVGGEGAGDLIIMMNETPTSAHAEHYAKIVQSCAVRRQSIPELLESVADAYREDGNFDLGKVIERLQRLQESRAITFEDPLEAGETLAALLATEFPPERWMVDGLILSDSFVGFGGKPKVGKGYFSLQMAQSVAYGTPFLGRETTQGKVLYLALEDGRRRIFRRLKHEQQATSSDQLKFVYSSPPLDTPEGLRFLVRHLNLYRPNLVIIDTLAGSKGGDFDENRAGDMAPQMNRIRQLAQERDIAIWGLFHHTKLAGGDALLDIRGSSAIGGAVDAVVGLYRDTSAPKRYILSTVGRDVPELDLQLRWDVGTTFCWYEHGEVDPLEATAAEQEALGVLTVLGEGDATTVAKELGKTRSTVARQLRKLEGKGKIIGEREQTRTKSRKVVYKPMPTIEAEELLF